MTAPNPAKHDFRGDVGGKGMERPKYMILVGVGEPAAHYAKAASWPRLEEV
jgi:hypothetical protein